MVNPSAGGAGLPRFAVDPGGGQKRGRVSERDIHQSLLLQGRKVAACAFRNFRRIEGLHLRSPLVHINLLLKIRRVDESEKL